MGVAVAADVKKPGRPRLTWVQVVNRDLESLGLPRNVSTANRSEWKGRLRARLAPPSSED